MKSFADNAGRTWLVNVNVGTIKRVRALCDIDLAGIITMEAGKTPKMDLLEQLASDPVLLVDVLYAVCKDEADGKQISDEDFGRAMAGDCLEQAITALLDEIIDFFPAAKRQVLQKILAASRRFETKTKLALETVLNDPELDRKIDAELERLTVSSAGSPESAG